MTKILWFTGLSGTGKSTLAKILSSKLSQLNFKVKIKQKVDSKYP